MIEELFFELIKVAIGELVCLSRMPSANEWKQLYDMAKKQSLVGVCFAGVQKTLSRSMIPGDTCQSNSTGSGHVSGLDPSVIGMPEILFLKWMGMTAKIQQRNEVVNQQCDDLQERLVVEGIGSCVLKGQGVATAYGNLSLLRQPGDIDLYLDCGMQRTLEYVQKVAPTNEINHKHVQLHCFYDTKVELHYIPAELHCPWQNRHLQKFFAEWNGKVRVMLASGQEIVVPCVEFQVVHQMVHAFRHLFGDGIGLRQVMDLYFVLKTFSVSPLMGDGVASIKNAIHATGMDRFASAMMWVLNHVFGNCSVPELVEGWGPNTRDGEFLLREIMMAGNFGYYDERIDRKGESRGHRFWRVTKQNWRLLRFSPWEVISTPLWRIWHFVWMRRRGFTQG